MAGAASELTPFWRVFAPVALAVFTPFIGLRIAYAERMPQHGSVIIAANHITDIDPVVVGLAVWKTGRVPRFLAKASLFSAPVLGTLMRALGHVPVERASRHGPDPLAAAGALIADGSAVIVYPEGSLTRQPELWPMRGKSGAVRLALASGAPIVPMAHWGAQRILPRWGRLLRLLPRHTVHLAVGEPIDIAPWKDRARDPAALAEATEYVMAAITALEEGLRGHTAPPGRWDPAQHGQSEYGRP